MTNIIIFVACLLFLLSLPYWLPNLIIKLRMYIFTRINGQETLQLPNKKYGPEEFRQVYSHEAVTGRSQGATLSDLFWYWLAPGPEMHQEHLENGIRYEKISAFTRKILAIPRSETELLIEQCMAKIFDKNDSQQPWQFVRIRDLMMPLWG